MNEVILRNALEFIASKSTCDCWDAPGIGSGLSYVWRGCEAYHSDDQDEWCLCCTAHAALAAAIQAERNSALVVDAGRT